MNKFLFLGAGLALSLLSCENDKEYDSDVNSEVISTEDFETKGSWSTVFVDHFNTGSDIGNKWNLTRRKDYNSRICEYKPFLSTISQLDGRQCLRLEARKVSSTSYISGHVKSKISFEPKNGEIYRVKASIKLIAKDGSRTKNFRDTYGAWPAFWTVQENGWPTKGEIDIMEGYSKSPQSAHFASNLFYGARELQNDIGTSAEKSMNVSEGWHTYEMQWRKNSTGYTTVTIYLDGVKIKTYSNSIHSKLRLQNFGPHNIILNLNVGSDTGIFNNSKIKLFSKTFMFVDYVRLEKRSI